MLSLEIDRSLANCGRVVFQIRFNVFCPIPKAGIGKVQR